MRTLSTGTPLPFSAAACRALRYSPKRAISPLMTSCGPTRGMLATASDTSTINATIVAVSAAVAIGLAGAAAFSVGAAIAHNLIGWDYGFTTADGTHSIAYGDKVRLADDYTHGGTPGAVYRYIGSPTSIDLGSENYGATTKWVSRTW